MFLPNFEKNYPNLWSYRVSGVGIFGTFSRNGPPDLLLLQFEYSREFWKKVPKFRMEVQGFFFWFWNFFSKWPTLSVPVPIWVFKRWKLTGDKLPIIRNAVKVESKKKAIRFCSDGGLSINSQHFTSILLSSSFKNWHVSARASFSSSRIGSFTIWFLILKNCLHRIRKFWRNTCKFWQFLEKFECQFWKISC